MSIISTSMILCTETSRWVAARCRDNYTLACMHTPLLVAMATHQWLLISPSLSFFFPLRFCFYPFLCLVCNPYCLYLLFIYQLLCPCPEPCLCICVTEYPHLCVFILSTDMVSHVHVQGLVSHLWQGKDKDSHSAYAHERSHFLLIRSIIIMRGGYTMDIPWKLPRQPVWHHTTHRAAGEVLNLSHIADRLKYKEQRMSAFVQCQISSYSSLKSSQDDQ